MTPARCRSTPTPRTSVAGVAGSGVGIVLQDVADVAELTVAETVRPFASPYPRCTSR